MIVHSDKIWIDDPMIKACGGLHKNHPDFESDKSLVDKLEYVFEMNVDLINRAQPDLNMTTVDLMVTSGLRRSAVAYAPKGRRAVIVEIGLLRAFWTRIAILAHTPEVLSAAFPITLASKPLWMSVDIDSVPGTDDWPVSKDRIEYCFNIFYYMLEYLVAHELAHHMRGHLDLDINKKRIKTIDEGLARQSYAEKELSENLFLLQDLEFDADAHGLDLSILSMAAKYPIKTWTAENVVEWQFQLIFAQLIVSHIFDIEGKETSAYTSDGHPAPVHRAINYSNLLSRTLHRLTGGNWAIYRDMHDTAWFEASTFAKQLGMVKGRWYDDDDKPLKTSDFHKLEQRFFTASERLDQIIDDETES